MTSDDRNAAWRQEVPVGWQTLYDRLIEDLTALDPDFRISQAKEKFGELRVYLERCPPGAHELIDEASRQSRRTCQVCGAPAVLRATRQGYYATECDAHAGEMQVVHRDPIVATFRFGPGGLTEIKRDPLD